MKKPLFILLFVLLAGGFFLQACQVTPRLKFGDGSREQWLAAHFSPDGMTLVTGDYGNSVKQYDTRTGRLLNELSFERSENDQPVHLTAHSKDGKYILACGHTLPLAVWDAKTGKLLRSIPSSKEEINAFSITPDEKHVLAIAHSRMLSLWELESGKQLKQRLINSGSHFPDNVQTLVFSQCGRFFVILDGPVFSVWNFQKMELMYSSAYQKKLFDTQIELPNFAVKGVALAPGGLSLLIAIRDGNLIELDIESGKQTKKYQIKPDGDIHVLAVSPKGDKIMTTGFHGNTIVYSFPECKEIKRMPGYGHVQFSPDGKTALTFTKNGRMMLWDLDK